MELKRGIIGAIFPLLLGLIGAGPAPMADEAGLRLLVDQRQVEVGGSVKVSIEFKHIGNESMALGNPSFSTPEHFEMGSFTSSFSNIAYDQGKEVVTSTTQFDLKAVKEGEETLGPAVLVYQDAQGRKVELRSNQVALQVLPKSGFSLFGHKKAEPAPTPTAVPASPDDLSDLKPLMPESHWVLRILVWGLAVLLLLGFLLWKFLGSKPKAPAAAPPLGQAAQLRDRLKKLGNDDIASKEFCEELSAIAREALQLRFGFPSVNFTTGEVLKALAKVKCSDDERVAAEKVLKTCDRVLYADGNLTGRDNLRTYCLALLPKAPKN